MQRDFSKVHIALHRRVDRLVDGFLDRERQDHAFALREGIGVEGRERVEFRCGQNASRDGRSGDVAGGGAMLEVDAHVQRRAVGERVSRQHQGERGVVLVTDGAGDGVRQDRRTALGTQDRIRRVLGRMHGHGGTHGEPTGHERGAAGRRHRLDQGGFVAMQSGVRHQGWEPAAGVRIQQCRHAHPRQGKRRRCVGGGRHELRGRPEKG